MVNIPGKRGWNKRIVTGNLISQKDYYLIASVISICQMYGVDVLNRDHERCLKEIKK